MNNNLKKSVHISEAKLNEILKLFCADLNATQIAQASEISRVTVNNYVKFFRVQIAKYCEGQKEMVFSNADLPAFNMKHYFSELQLRNEQLTPGVGVIINGESLIADPLNNINSSVLIEHLKKGGAACTMAHTTTTVKMYNAIIDFEKKRMYRIKEGLLFKNDRHDSDEIDFFWKLLKMRIVKMRGVQVSSLYLHVKEAEFRYNNRNKELYEILLPLVNNARTRLN